MKNIFVLCVLFLGWTSYAGTVEEFPKTEISNGLIKASLFLPDATNGYYQATRFDWSGAIQSLEYKGHSFFGEWFKKHNPKQNDGITGPVEEFDPIGYDDAKAGENFIKIGVGVLRKPDTKPYSSFTLYEIANQGKWTVKTLKDRVIYTQELKDETGYAYIYTKTVRLVKGKPQMVLEHSLKNTGTKTLESNVFDHNFFVIDKEPTGPGVKIKFPFDIQGTGRGLGTLAEVKGKEITYIKGLQGNESVHIMALTGFGPTAKDYDFRIENQKTGGAVRITGDTPLSKMVFWSNPSTACPEPYILVKAAPGKEFKWKIFYEFYENPVERAAQ